MRNFLFLAMCSIFFTLSAQNFEPQVINDGQSTDIVVVDNDVGQIQSEFTVTYVTYSITPTESNQNYYSGAFNVPDKVYVCNSTPTINSRFDAVNGLYCNTYVNQTNLNNDTNHRLSLFRLEN